MFVVLVIFLVEIVYLLRYSFLEFFVFLGI